MCIIYRKKRVALENGGMATLVAKVGEAAPASGFARESEKPLAGNKESQPTPGRDSSVRSGLVPTGRGRRSLIRGNTAAWR